MNWTSDQKKIIDARNGNVLVSAAAGSGKTAVLVERIIQMISDPQHLMNVDELLVVTFTKAAAAQMKDKIAAAIEEKLKKEPQNEHMLKQMNLIHHANILTIDSFCYQVVREHFHILGMDPNIRIGDAGEVGILREDVLAQVMEECYKNNPHFAEFSDAFSADKNDDKVEEYILKIYDVCSSYPKPEEWIENAVAALKVQSEEEFVLLPVVQAFFHEIHCSAEGIEVFARQALEETQKPDGPIHMEKAVRADIALLQGIQSARTYSRFADLRNEKFERIGRGKKGTYDEDTAQKVKDIRDHYKKQIQLLLAAFELPFEEILHQYKQQEPMLNALLACAGMFRERFLEEKLKKGVLEFSDVEHFALKVLCGGYDKNGIPVPSDIGRELSAQFQEILIDEYQDSNFLQEAILNCVSRSWQGEHNMFMVGDVKQSIYSFRMARPDLFMEKYETYSEENTAPCRKLLLKNNFRSRANVLETVNYLFYQIMGKDLGGIEYTTEQALVPGREYPPLECDEAELLLGESKEFEFLEQEVMADGTQEMLDDNLEDIGKMELEATMVAGRIEKLLGRSDGNAYQVTDEEHGGLRPVQLKDIVILFRAPSAFSPVFQEVLMKRDIPVCVQSGKGYFDTVEIRMLCSLLQVLDNPHNDVEMAAVLRGYFGGFSSDELALFALQKRSVEKQLDRKLYLYTILKALAECAEGERDSAADPEGKTNTSKKADSTINTADGLTKVVACIRSVQESDKEEKQLVPKCRNLLRLLETFQEKKAHSSISELLTDIYYETHFYYYVQVMPDGIQRTTNLNLFLEETKQFEQGGVRSLFDFLRFVDKLNEKSISLGADPSNEAGENAVRIMSIHKSKGLEFPVVFLSGLGKQFNRMDTKTPLIVHSDYYLGAKYVDVDKRRGNDTFIRKAQAALMITEGIAEELRILYVALTRAKEKLILTGVATDIPALIKRFQFIANKQEEKLSYSVVHMAGSYLDLIVAALIRNEQFHSAMKEVRKRFDKKGEQIVSAEYEKMYIQKEPKIRLAISIYDFKSIVVGHVTSNMEKQVNRTVKLNSMRGMPGMREKQIKEHLEWQYEKEALTKQKSKLSVTEIRRIYETDHTPSDVVEEPVWKLENYKAPLPYFMEQEQVVTPAQKGTYIHKMMELLDNAFVDTMEKAETALEQMWDKEQLPEETKAFIKADQIACFIASPIGKRMCEAAREGRLYKEKQFVVGVNPDRLLKTNIPPASENPIVVQGIIDAYFEEDDELVLLDYKTDRIKEGQEELLADRYRTQLKYYKETLEQLTGKKVKETYLYSFALGGEILVNL